MKVPITIIIPTKNEGNNLKDCLNAIVHWAEEIVIVDSSSIDCTLKIAKDFGVKIEQFKYNGGWPKKRQWALDNLSFKNEWILLLDADEILTKQSKEEIEKAIMDENVNGYYIYLQSFFLGKRLKYAYPGLYKLSLFRTGCGKFEKRLKNQDLSMADMEVHEHFIVNGPKKKLRKPIIHRNLNNLDRYILKHNEYSNWEAEVYLNSEETKLKPTIFGNQAQKRRWLKKKLMNWPFMYLMYFFYLFFIRLGFLDGKPGFYYCAFQAIQLFHIKAKIYEKKISNE